jgi:carbonic anhydrase
LSAHWLSEIAGANAAFRERIDLQALPDSGPNQRLVITCMDSRINLEAIGIGAALPHGETQSRVGVIRTAGARIDRRSLFMALYWANVTEIIVLGHTNCAVQAAHQSVPVMSDRMRDRVPGSEIAKFRDEIGATNDDLRQWMRTFKGLDQGVIDEVEYIKTLPFTGPDLIVHGLTYDVTTGWVNLVVDGN